MATPDPSHGAIDANSKSVKLCRPLSDHPGNASTCPTCRRMMAREWRGFTMTSPAGATDVELPSAGEGADLFFDLHMFVCTNHRPAGHRRGSCGASGSERLRDYMKARAKEFGGVSVRVNSAGCLDRCELGPCVVVYPAGRWYRIAREDDVDRLLHECLGGGARATDLLLPTKRAGSRA